MPSTDPFHRLVNPYAQGGAADDSGRSARAAGRALAVGALGLGAVGVFTGTGLAAEGDGAGDTTDTSEIAATGAGDAVEGDAGGTVVEGDAGGTVVEGGAGDAGGTVVEEVTEFGEPEFGDPGDSEFSIPVNASSDPEFVILADASIDPEFSIPVGAEAPVDVTAMPEGGTGATGVDSVETPGYDAVIAQSGAAELEIQPSADQGQLEEFTGDWSTFDPETQYDLGALLDADFDFNQILNDPDVTQAMNDVFNNGDGVFTLDGQQYDISQTVQQVRDMPVADAAGTPTTFGQAVAQNVLNPSAPTQYRLPPQERAGITARQNQITNANNGEITGPFNPAPVALGENFTYTPWGINTEGVQPILGGGNLGVGGLTTHEGQFRYQDSEALSPDTTFTTDNVVTLNPRTRQSAYLTGGPDGDPALPGDGFTASSNNRVTYEFGTPRPEQLPTTGTASWNGGTAGLGLGVNVTGQNSTGPGNTAFTTTVTPSASAQWNAGEIGPDGRWNVGGAVSGSQTLGGPNPDMLTVNGRVNAMGEIGEPRVDGRIADGNGAYLGAEANAGFTGQYGTQQLPTSTPGVTVPVDSVENTSFGGRIYGGAAFAENANREGLSGNVDASVGANFANRSVTADGNTTSTGFVPTYTGNVAGGLQYRTAPTGESGVYGRLDGSGQLSSTNGQSSSVVEGTARVGADINLGGNTTINPYVGYQVVAGNDPTNGSRTDDGVVAGVNGGFNAFGSRVEPGVQYDAANLDGSSSVQFRVNVTPGGARQARPAEGPVGIMTPVDGGFNFAAPTDIPQFDPNSPNLGFVPPSGEVTTPTAPEVSEPGPVSLDAADLGAPISVGTAPTTPTSEASVGAETVGSSLDLSNVEFVGAEGEVLAGPGDLGGFTGDAVDLGVDLGAPVEVAPVEVAPVEVAPVGSSLDLSNVEFVGTGGEVLAGPGDLGGFTGDTVDLGANLDLGSLPQPSPALADFSTPAPSFEIAPAPSNSFNFTDPSNNFSFSPTTSFSSFSSFGGF